MKRAQTAIVPKPISNVFVFGHRGILPVFFFFVFRRSVARDRLCRQHLFICTRPNVLQKQKTPYNSWFKYFLSVFRSRQTPTFVIHSFLVCECECGAINSGGNIYIRMYAKVNVLYNIILRYQPFRTACACKSHTNTY